MQTQKSIEQSKIELERSKLKTQQLEREYYNLMSDLYLKTNNSFKQWEASENNLKDYMVNLAKWEAAQRWCQKNGVMWRIANENNTNNMFK